jgi:hypothetical protein
VKLFLQSRAELGLLFFLQSPAEVGFLLILQSPAEFGLLLFLMSISAVAPFPGLTIPVDPCSSFPGIVLIGHFITSHFLMRQYVALKWW